VHQAICHVTVPRNLWFIRKGFIRPIPVTGNLFRVFIVWFHRRQPLRLVIPEAYERPFFGMINKTQNNLKKVLTDR